jgi:pyruvate kinase
MRRFRSTKIVATLGPASSDAEMIRNLFEAGVDVFRFNFSHGSHEDHQKRCDIVRALEKDSGRPISIMADLQGPKLRIGTFPDGPIELQAGDRFRLELKQGPGTRKRVTLPHPEIFAALETGTDLLLDDGKVRLRVLKCDDKSADTEVVTGGPLSALTPKDQDDMRFALDMGADWIALSFVQRPEDVAEARKLIAGRASVLVKLEKPAAIDQLEQIVEIADAVMVARGDLGVELPPEQVPPIQKRIVRLCRSLGKPVIVATQMLDSMVNAPSPTRAEASDVATAVYDNADAVMLSAETAAGKYPLESVTMMNQIIRTVESDDFYLSAAHADQPTPDRTVSDAITLAAREVAESIDAGCIVTYTTSGSTTIRASRERPTVPILCITSSMKTARRLAMAWGVHAVAIAQEERFSAIVQRATEVAKSEGFAGTGDKVVITAGVPMGKPGSTNVLRVERIP